jgi:hypothetical protein
MRWSVETLILHTLLFAPTFLNAMIELILKTTNCVCCLKPETRILTGHVLATIKTKEEEEAFPLAHATKTIHIMAQFCSQKCLDKTRRDSINIPGHGCFGEYTKDMGIAIWR